MKHVFKHASLTRARINIEKHLNFKSFHINIAEKNALS